MSEWVTLIALQPKNVKTIRDYPDTFNYFTGSLTWRKLSNRITKIEPKLFKCEKNTLTGPSLAEFRIKSDVPENMIRPKMIPENFKIRTIVKKDDKQELDGSDCYLYVHAPLLYLLITKATGSKYVKHALQHHWDYYQGQILGVSHYVGYQTVSKIHQAVKSLTLADLRKAYDPEWILKQRGYHQIRSVDKGDVTEALKFFKEFKQFIKAANDNKLSICVHVC